MVHFRLNFQLQLLKTCQVVRLLVKVGLASTFVAFWGSKNFVHKDCPACKVHS